MCSIAGIYRTGATDVATDDVELLHEMNRIQKHRGPDDSAIYAFSRGGLAHNRLAVVDLAGGAQPMPITYEGHHYVIAYNGEIYNAKELRLELEARGATFRTNSDTEVVAFAYAVWGMDCPNHLNGIFAFAVYNEENETLFLARDRFGIKPLFFTERDGEFRFASEVKALLVGQKARLDREGLWQLFFLSPASLNGSGVLKGIFELKPAECAMLSKEGFHRQHYWQLRAEPCTMTRDEIIDHTRALMVDTVERQLVSDVPLACFLSGGLDSSAITAIASRAYQREGQTLSTYSFTYEDMDSFHATLFQPNRDDDYATWLANELSCAHTVLTAPTERVAGLLGAAALARDMPGQADIDSSLYYFCSRVKERHTVALSGECADEIFGGYPWFYRPEMLNRDFFPWIHNPCARIRLLRPEVAHEADGLAFMKDAYRASLQAVPCLDSDNDAMRLSRRATCLSVNYFMTNLLERKDRMSMAHGLEVRVPFSDHRILEFVYNVPWEIKFENGVEKALLRHAMAGYLPKKILWRKKSPYPKTHSHAYERCVRAMLAERMESEDSILHRVLNRAALTALCEQESATWYGQLMSTPQLLAWLLQFDVFCEAYQVELCDE